MPSPHSPAPILVVGSANIDLALEVDRHPGPGETVSGTRSARSPGGKGANQACAAARLGGHVVFAGRTGEGPDADDALALLREAGADLLATTAVPGAETGLAVATVDASGENSIVVIPGANGTWDAAAIDALAGEVADAGIVVSQGEIPAPAVDALAALCARHSARFLLNLAPVIAVDRTTLLVADPLVVNEHEGSLALAALGVDVPEDDGAVVEALRDVGIAAVVMTRGSRGAIVADASGMHQIPSPSVTSVDSTGAGDAVVGALAVGIARSEDLRTAAGLAVRVGAFAVTRRGAQASYPAAAEELPR